MSYLLDLRKIVGNRPLVVAGNCVLEQNVFTREFYDFYT